MIEKRNCYLVSYNGLSNAGGVEKVSYYLNKILQKRDFNIILVDKQLIEESFLGKLFGIIFKKVPITVFTLLASFYIRFYKKRDDISITQGFNAPFLKTDYLYVHGTMRGYVESVGQKKTFALRMLFFLEKIAIKNAKKILSVSQNAIDEIEKFYTKKQLDYSIVNNGVESDNFFPNISNLPTSQITVLYCGRLDEGKGLSQLLNLAAEAEQDPKIKFLIACNNNCNTDLFRKFNRTQINIGLSSDDMSLFYNKGNILFFPSLYEGFEMVSLEALSSGIPVLGNKVGAVAELKKNNAPGVYIIDYCRPILKQIREIVDQNNDKQYFLHQYYKSRFDIVVYAEKLNKIIN